MIKKGILVLFVSAFVITLAGCQTIKGAASGAAAGFSEDWKSAKKMDDWLRQNLW